MLLLRRLSLPLFLLVSAARSQAVLDLTPTLVEYSSEGFTYQRLDFKDGDRRASFNLPMGWSFRSGGDGLRLAPREKSFVEAVIQARPAVWPQPWDDAAMKTFEQQALSGVPPGSQAIELVRREPNPVGINQSLSFGVVVAYQTLGHTFLRSVTFIQTPDTQLTLRFTAPKAEFGELHQTFRSSIASWHWVDTKPVQSGATTSPGQD